MFPALALLTGIVALATFLPFLRLSHWTIRGLDFPRMQFVVISAVLLMAHTILLDTGSLTTQVLLCVTLLCFVWHLWWIFPYTPVWPREVAAAGKTRAQNQLCILSSNVLKENRNSETLIALVAEHRPDILVTLETDVWWEQELKVLESEMPYTVKCPLENLYGMHVYSRLPLENQEISYLVEQDVPSIHASIIMRSGDKVRVHFLHPAPPSPTENSESAERDAELAIVARSVAESDLPVVVAGDLNDVAWSATTRLFRKVSGLLDPRVGRGFFNTYNARYPFVRWPLDHVFHSQHFTLLDIRRLPDIGSDHFPLLARLAFTPSLSVEQQGLEANASDYARSIELSEVKGVGKDDVPIPE